MSLPVWQANYAYLLGARVSKVTTDGTAWLSTAAGTSGAVEPTWPTTDPWTVTDGTTAWMLASSWRTMTVAAIMTVLTNFRSANPTLLNGLAVAKPLTLSQLDMPGVYVASRDESIVMGAGLRTRTFDPGTGLSVVVVDKTPDPSEAESRMDVLVDGLVDAFTAAYHAVDGYSILQPTRVRDVEIADPGNVPHIANMIYLGLTSKTEGRQ